MEATAGGRIFLYKAPQLWKCLPNSVWDSGTVSMFKCGFLLIVQGVDLKDSLAMRFG